MASANGTLSSSLDVLERRFDGPVPSELRRAARAGGRPQAAALQAATESLLIDRLAGHATQALARLRPQGFTDPDDSTMAAVARDLALYRRAGLAWFRHANAAPPVTRQSGKTPTLSDRGRT